MKVKTGLILGIAVSLIVLSSNKVFSQETQSKEKAMPEMKAEPAQSGGAGSPEAKSDQETQWVWGEVSSVDAQNKAVVIKYLDYESDQEKEITINADDKTNYENIKSFEEINPKDTLSVDYIVSADGRNVAKNISAEKPEAAPAPLATQESVPENPQPVPSEKY